MEAALEISFYVLGVVFALGLLMVLVLVRDVFFHGRFNTVLPPVKRVPATALDAARAVLKQLQEAQRGAQGQRRDTIAYEIRHLEHRIDALEDKTYTDQSDYYAAAKARERVWREWRATHAQAREAHFGERRALRIRLDELRQEYAKLNREVEEEYHRSVARDALALEELRSQGVLEPEVLRPPREAAPAPAQAAPEAPPAANGAPAEGASAQPEPAPGAAAQPAQRSSKWMTPLAAYPPAQGGLLGQTDMAQPDLPKSGRTYVDPAFSSAALPGGALSGADLSRSSFAEVEFTGVQRIVGCSLVAADLRRIEMKRAEAPHLIQDCDLRGASLAQAHLAGVVMRRCNLGATHWRNARLDRVRFEGCNLEGVHWEGVDLSRTVMSADMLAAADFTFAGKPPLNVQPPLESPPELARPAPQRAPAGEAPPRAPAAQQPPQPPPGAPSQAPPPDVPPADAAQRPSAPVQAPPQPPEPPEPPREPDPGGPQRPPREE